MSLTTHRSIGTLPLVEKGAFEIFIPLPDFEQFYLQSGGKRRFSEYGILEGIVFTFEDRIRSSLAFFQYHIATDASFNVFQAILSRRSFARRPQKILERVYRVFDESLCSLGALGLGKRDTLTGSTLERRYRRLDGKNALYKKID